MPLALLYHPLLEAVGAALIHSLWQGGLVAGGVYLVICVIKPDDSRARYTVYCAALLLLFLLPLSTGVQVYLANQPQTHSYYGMEESVTASADSVIGAIPEASDRHRVPPEASEAPVLGAYRAMFTYRAMFPWHPFVVGAWLIGMLLFSVRWGMGLWVVRSLKRKGIDLEIESIQTAFTALLVRMGIQRNVRLVITVHVTQPMVIGWLKPVVLLPLSVATNLSPDQVEAILVHELAHVRRQDYLVLLLQSVMEVLFFYHPVVWWISHRMRIEREYLCDELATSGLCNELVYAKALANLEKGRARQMALGAGDGKLVDRIRRIFKRKVEGAGSETRFSWVSVSLLLFSCTFLASACLNWGEPNLNGAPDDLYIAASEHVKEHNYTAALPYLEKAAEQGHICSLWLLSEMYEQKKGPHTGEDGMRYLPVKWGYKNNEESLRWTHVIKDVVIEKADAGDSNAMMLMAAGYRKDFTLGMYSKAFEKNDSLSSLWLDRAVALNNPYAIRWKAGDVARTQKDFAVSDSLFARAAELGDEAAYFWWSMNYASEPSPQRLFEILDMALEKQASGAHKRIRETLTALDKQAALGNEESKRWLAVADSFRFEERMIEIPEVAFTGHFPEFSYYTECGLDLEWFYYPDGKSSSWVDKNGEE